MGHELLLHLYGFLVMDSIPLRIKNRAGYRRIRRRIVNVLKLLCRKSPIKVFKQDCSWREIEILERPTLRLYPLEFTIGSRRKSIDELKDKRVTCLKLLSRVCHNGRHLHRIDRLVEKSL